MECVPNKTTKRVWESVQLYTVKCANCAKWRLIPTKEKYEEIREKIEERPFSCEKVREWRPEISCEDESDVEQNGNMCWAMDKPSIPQTPPGWQRIIRIRAEGGSKFADVYYVSPSNKRLRSRVELNRYLDEHPKYTQEGVNISKFTFLSPAPLDENYVAKRRARATSSHDLSIVPFEANSVPQSAPNENVDYSFPDHSDFSFAKKSLF